MMPLVPLLMVSAVPWVSLCPSRPESSWATFDQSRSVVQ